MFHASIYGEKLVAQYTYKNIPFEVVSCPATVWCGTLGYAPDCMEEPEIGSLLQKYQELCDIPKAKPAKPEWSCAISINYWQNGAAPRGMMFAQQVLTEEQELCHDIYTMPESLFIKATNSAETAKSAFGKDSCELFELFGVIKESLAETGYVLGTNGAQEIEMYNHSAGLFYAYVPVMLREEYGI